MSNKIDLSQDYYSVSECAKRLAKTPQTIYMWIKTGKFGPVIKVGSTYMVKIQDFDNWVSLNVKEY